MSFSSLEFFYVYGERCASYFGEINKNNVIMTGRKVIINFATDDLVYIVNAFYLIPLLYRLVGDGVCGGFMIK